MFSDNIITGEKIQDLADVYLGEPNDFLYNPYIASQIHKHQLLDQLPEIYDNPPYMFCYTHRLEKLANKISFFQNPFVLITHNSDDNVLNNKTTMQILSNDRLITWFSQNVAIAHDKLVLLPIGMANRQWPHGDIDFFDHFVIPIVKTKHIYFYFNVGTNVTKRMDCFQQLCQKIPVSPPMSPEDYKRHLADYQFCICPEGNGYDTHRFWEALYLKVIPIVIQSNFVTQLRNTFPNIPMVVLESWEDLHPDTLDYQTLYKEYGQRAERLQQLSPEQASLAEDFGCGIRRRVEDNHAYSEGRLCEAWSPEEYDNISMKSHAIKILSIFDIFDVQMCKDIKVV